ncbi:MAG: hypothetical protein H6712_15100 [Myxococcales bacterium]|nr:hypothetical protein [Myxococcales bacterium]MCB9715192.1 hypothetical protein [Myxococcales bacterium]
MDVNAFLRELTDIEAHGVDVVVNRAAHRTTYEFSSGRYFHPEIRRIQVQRGGAGVIYVYTSNDNYPHLTIPFEGVNLHWTNAQRLRIGDRAGWPESVRRLVDMF